MKPNTRGAGFCGANKTAKEDRISLRERVICTAVGSFLLTGHTSTVHDSHFGATKRSCPCRTSLLFVHAANITHNEHTTTQELLPQVKAILILDEDGGRVSCKYHDRKQFPNLGAEAMFEHKLFRKTKSVS